MVNLFVAFLLISQVEISLSIAVLICWGVRPNCSLKENNHVISCPLLTSIQRHLQSLWFALSIKWKNKRKALTSLYHSRSSIFLCNFTRQLIELICEINKTRKKPSQIVWNDVAVIAYAGSTLHQQFGTVLVL